MIAAARLMFFGSMMLPDECQRSPGCPFSANRFQFELLSRLHGAYAEEITAICPIPTPSFPRVRPLLWGRRDRAANARFRIISPSFVNLGPLKVLSLILSVFITAIMHARAHGVPQIILLYNPYLGYTLPALLLARLWRIPVVGIVADLPPRIPWTWRGFTRQTEAYLQHWAVRHFDGLLPFSIHVASDLKFQGPVMRLDPGVEATDFENLSPLDDYQHTRALLFSGVLNAANGLPLLLGAFAQVSDPTIHLWISGRGEMQSHVEKAARSDPRIRYWGFVERRELLRMMKSSRVLTNPRPASLPEHRYNFPSKILEYLAVGRPVISTATSDVAKEYGAYLILLDTETPQALAHLIESVFARSDAELDGIGERGRRYVLAEKNWEVLSHHVARFLASLREATTDA